MIRKEYGKIDRRRPVDASTTSGQSQAVPMSKFPLSIMTHLLGRGYLMKQSQGSNGNVESTSMGDFEQCLGVFLETEEKQDRASATKVIDLLSIKSSSTHT